VSREGARGSTPLCYRCRCLLRRTSLRVLPLKVPTHVRNLLVAVLLPVAPAFSAGVHATPSEVTSILAEAAKHPVQTTVVRTTGGIDITGWTLIAVVHGVDAELVREGQRVRAVSVNARGRMHLAWVSRVTRQPTGVRVEATLAARVLGVATRYLMEIETGSI